MLARGTREWVRRDGGWAIEYMMFCLGFALSSAGACELAYRTGHADRDINELSEDAATGVRSRRSAVYG